MIKQIPAKVFFPKSYTLSVGNVSVEVCKDKTRVRSWKSFCRGDLLKFDFKGQAYTIDILLSNAVITTVQDGENSFKNVITLDEKFEWESNMITSSDYKIEIKEGLLSTRVIVDYRETQIFELKGSQFKWRHLRYPSESWAIGEETKDFVFDRDVAILLYCMHWLNYGELSH